MAYVKKVKQRTKPSELENLFRAFKGQGDFLGRDLDRLLAVDFRKVLT
jgi:hypothetical protein